jgi:hypothetical protein
VGSWFLVTWNGSEQCWGVVLRKKYIGRLRSESCRERPERERVVLYQQHGRHMQSRQERERERAQWYPLVRVELEGRVSTPCVTVCAMTEKRYRYL